MSNFFYTLVLDSDLDGKFRELKKKFKPGERIISTNIEGNKMFVTTEAPDAGKNLLLG